MSTNRKTRTLIAMLGVALGLTAAGAQAGWGHSSYTHAQAYQHSRQFHHLTDARQARQIEYLRIGLQTGQLTRREFRELMVEQDRIRIMERHFRADGRLDAREVARLDRALAQADHRIRAQASPHQARSPYAYPGRLN